MNSVRDSNSTEKLPFHIGQGVDGLGEPLKIQLPKSSWNKYVRMYMYTCRNLVCHDNLADDIQTKFSIVRIEMPNSRIGIKPLLISTIHHLGTYMYCVVFLNTGGYN